MQRPGDPAGTVLRSMLAVWRRQSWFGKVLMVIGAVNVAACLLLGLSLVIYSVLPERSALIAWRAGPWLPTAAPEPTEVPLPTPSPTDGSTPTPRPTPTTTAMPTPTRTPTARPSPRPTLTPVGRIEVSARVSNGAPRPLSRVTVYGRITKDGVGIAGVRMRARWSFRSDVVTCSDTSDRSGEASCSTRIGVASRGHYVPVEVTFTYEGKTYTATTGFTPQ